MERQYTLIRFDKIWLSLYLFPDFQNIYPYGQTW